MHEQYARGNLLPHRWRNSVLSFEAIGSVHSRKAVSTSSFRDAVWIPKNVDPTETALSDSGRSEVLPAVAERQDPALPGCLCRQGERQTVCTGGTINVRNLRSV